MTEDGGELIRPEVGGEVSRVGAEGLTRGLDPVLIGELVAV